ncbi:hypothetical protein KFU94_62555 [Chloroflexi bacterium TSY]|nr:hypothetical protein [Chloroflexi bacterium TSY]
MILEEDTTLIGYAVFKGQIFGRYPSSFTVDEIAAKNADAVRNLLVAIANRCRELGLEEFIIREPIDSAVGWEARQLGCEYKQFIPHTGEMMGVILNREGLLEDLEPELRRRVPHESLYQEHDVAFLYYDEGIDSR